MAEILEEAKKRQIVLHRHTEKSGTTFENAIKTNNNALENEIIIQHDYEHQDASLYTLHAADGSEVNIVRFPSEKEIKGIVSGASDTLQKELDKTQVGAGLSGDGSYVKDDSTNYLKEAESLKDADKKLDSELKKTNDALEKAKVSSSDKTITISTGGTNTDISVNIDNNTLVKDSTSGVISVSPTATSVEGENAIVVTGVTSGKKVSLKIVTGEKVLSQDDEGLKSTISIKSGDTPVYTEYKLVGTGDTVVLGDVIKIPKDSSLANVFMGHVDDKLNGANDDNVSSESGVTSGSGNTSLNFIYILHDRSYKLVAVDVSQFLEEAQFGIGLEVVDHKVNVKIDNSNDGKYLFVSENGVTLSGITEAIAKAATVVNHATGNTHVTVTSSTESDGHIVYTINESDIASDTAFKAVSGIVETLSGHVDTAITNIETLSGSVSANTTKIDNIISAVGLTETGSYATANDAPYISGATSALDADKKLADAVKAVDDKVGQVTITISGNSTNYLEATGMTIGAKIEKLENITTSDTETKDGLLSAKDTFDYIQNLVIDCGEF